MNQDWKLSAAYDLTSIVVSLERRDLAMIGGNDVRDRVALTN
jgi:hypothetical protein